MTVFATTYIGRARHSGRADDVGIPLLPAARAPLVAPHPPRRRDLTFPRTPGFSCCGSLSVLRSCNTESTSSPRKDSMHARITEHRPCSRSLGRRPLLEQRNRAPAGRRLKSHRPQLPETSLGDDVARVRHVLTRQSGPTVLAAHSYGGQVVTSLGTDAPNVVGLVYIAAFGLDEGESIGALLQQGPPTPAVANIDVDSESFAWIPEDDFLGHFAADFDPVKAKVMYAVQQPLHMSTFDDVMGAPAWKSLPSWYLVAENDEVIPPDAERQFAQRMGADTIEVASGHCAMVSHPEETHGRIVTAANAVAVAA